MYTALCYGTRIIVGGQENRRVFCVGFKVENMVQKKKGNKYKYKRVIYVCTTSGETAITRQNEAELNKHATARVL